MLNYIDLFLFKIILCYSKKEHKIIISYYNLLQEYLIKICKEIPYCFIVSKFMWFISNARLLLSLSRTKVLFFSVLFYSILLGWNLILFSILYLSWFYIFLLIYSFSKDMEKHILYFFIYLFVMTYQLLLKS